MPAAETPDTPPSDPTPARPPQPPGAGWPAPPGGPPPVLVGTLPAPPWGPGRPRPGVPDWVPVLLAVLAGLWTVLVVLLLPGAGGWVVAESLTELNQPQPPWLWPALSWAAALLVGVPAILLAVLPRVATVRATGRTWAWGALGLGLLGSARAVPVQHHELYLALVAAGALALSLLAGRVHRAGRAPGPVRAAAVPLAVAAGLVALLPWLWLGALGGALETLLAAVAAGCAGLLASRALDLRPFAGRRPAVGVLVAGLAAGVYLTTLAVALGGSGVHLAELLILPPLGFAAAALVVAARPATPGTATPDAAMPAPGGSAGGDRATRRAVALLVGLAAFGPLAFVDPEETTPLLGDRDIWYWALRAALLGLAVALLVGLGYGLLAPRVRLRRPVAAALAGLVAVAGLAVYAGPGHPGLYDDQLFVVMKSQADLSGLAAIRDRDERLRQTYRRLVAHADATQAPLRAQLRRLHVDFTPYYLVDGLRVRGGPLLRAWLSHRPDVDRVLLNPRLRPLPEEPSPGTGRIKTDDSAQWNIRMLHANEVWARGDTGRGIVIGSSDSGVDGTHPALETGFRGGDDSWYDPWNGSRSPVDHNGHGTHTTGSAVGRRGVGVAPGAQWMACVNLDRNMGDPAYYLDCLQFMLAPFPPGGNPLRDGRPARAPHILTNSWGCPGLEGCDARSLRPAIDALTAAGIFVVAAAGNSGPSCRTITDPPAPYPDAETVGAVDRHRVVADFSSRGPVPGTTKPDVSAPGVAVLSAWPGGGYRTESGTSMATPQVAGVVALMWSANPALVGDIATTRRILRDTATPAAPTRAGCAGADATGAGIVDAAAAVAAAREAPAV